MPLCSRCSIGSHPRVSNKFLTKTYTACLIQSPTSSLSPSWVPHWLTPTSLLGLKPTGHISASEPCTCSSPCLECSSPRVSSSLCWHENVSSHVEEVHMPGPCGHPPGPEGRLQPTYSENRRPSVINHKEVSSANSLNEMRSRFFPSQDSTWEFHSLTDTV